MAGASLTLPSVRTTLIVAAAVALVGFFNIQLAARDRAAGLAWIAAEGRVGLPGEIRFPFRWLLTACVVVVAARMAWRDRPSPPSFEDSEAPHPTDPRDGPVDEHRSNSSTPDPEIDAVQERAYLEHLGWKAMGQVPPIVPVGRHPRALLLSSASRVPMREQEQECGVPGAGGPRANRPETLELPILGRIAAGPPIAAIQHERAHMAVPKSMLGAGEHFILEVDGDSMINAGIFSGDYAIIRRAYTAVSGDIVVALVMREDACLARLRLKGGLIALEMANPAYETRIFGPDQVEVQGTLAGLIRRYR
jgi:repressor LexA